jgi:molybdopterin-guanine dinucleotide biosynthesis protein A
MKVIILAGGFGTRLSEYTETLPKPMVSIGGKPILWHIMKSFAHFGHKEFIMCHNIGFPPMDTIGFGKVSVYSESLVPKPPAKMITFILRSNQMQTQW